jgi:hypothetical protein
MRNAILLASLAPLFLACSGGSAHVPDGRPAPAHPPANVAPAPDPGCTGSGCAYDGDGFVVHEWGTNTFVVGSDGVPLRGLHHEEEDLPAFVYDRVKAGMLPGGAVEADGKMETPVTYFYSPTPLKAKVSVQFPEGVLTQWYPTVRTFSPLVVKKNGALVDPVFTPACQSYEHPSNSMLDWGEVDVLGRDANVDALLPEAPLDRYTWSHARAVAANPLRVAGESSQTERFLFYRGLGNIAPPAQVSYREGVRVANPSANGATGALFVLNVGPTSAAFKVVREGVAPGATATIAPPADAERKPLDAYADELSNEVIRALDATGLYHDEAMSMVNTWRRQWFRTPGLRVLYLAAPSWIDRTIPLAVDPAPKKIARAMVIRVELLTPNVEDDDLKWAWGFQAPDSEARKHFEALGRFAEPRLRRALALMNAPAPAGAQQYLMQLAKANTSSGLGE